MLEKMTENCSRAEVEQAYHMVKGESGKVSREDLKAAAAELGGSGEVFMVVKTMRHQVNI